MQPRDFQVWLEAMQKFAERRGFQAAYDLLEENKSRLTIGEYEFAKAVLKEVERDKNGRLT